MDPDFLDMFSNRNSPVKVFREPDAEESPIKPPTKKSRLNLENFSGSHKKVLNFSYGRVQSHSTSRTKEPEDESKIIRKQWLDGLEKFGVRSVSREISSKMPRKDENDVEIQQLNSRIRNLIRENSELKAQVEIYDKRLKGKGATSKLNFQANENSSFEVTFKPQDLVDAGFKNHKRFPRDIFRLPRGKK
jgi:hypothetical protein